MRWKIFYADGSTFGSNEGAPVDAPGGGIIAIAQEDDVVGIEISSGNDFYVFDESIGGWGEMDVFGLTQYILRPGYKIIKLGQLISTKDYRALMVKIRSDPELPDKSAWYPEERHL